MIDVLTKKDFINKYGYVSYNDIKDYIINNLATLKYNKQISGYKILNNKNYAIIYLPHNKSMVEQRYISIDLIKLYNLLIQDCSVFINYINNNYKIKEQKV